ncbi:MAG: helix-turn-helix domain-containing protein [Clostridia bacterium]|jgi:DNA-binding IclR family transcriptional regulator|nr:helix-turn-helix domain-containing protein [Clostridia bacterium]
MVTHLPRARYRLNSVDNALQILEALARPEAELNAGELGALLGISRSSAFRLLATLELRGFVRQNPATGRYRLGLKLLHLGGAVLKSLRLNEEARPVLRELAARSGETVHLGVLDTGELVFIEKIESPAPSAWDRTWERACPPTARPPASFCWPTSPRTN